MIQDLRSAVDYVRQNSIQAVLERVLRKDVHPGLQFLKYSIAGGAAVLTYQCTFGVLGLTFFPHFEGSVTASGELIPDATRKVYFILASSVGFLLSDVVAYITNLLWVFQGGRHHRVLEFLLFTAASAVGWIAGMIPGVLAFDSEHGGSWTSSIIVTVTSIIVNFLTRKLLIFRN